MTEPIPLTTYPHPAEYDDGSTPHPRSSYMDQKTDGQYSGLYDHASVNEQPLYPGHARDSLPRIDEPFHAYPDSPAHSPPELHPNDKSDVSLVRNAGKFSGGPSYGYVEADPLDGKHEDSAPRGPLARFFPSGRYPLQQRIEDKKRGIGRQKYPILTWVLTATMIAVFIYEIVVNAKAQGSPFSFKPVVNPMLGPSGSALIRVGARFPPCMKTVQDVPVTLQLPCLNDTANPPDRLCTIESICDHGGFNGQEPNQWWRFITPIFLHAGLIHLALNMLAQMTAAAQIEKEMGTGGFFLLYFSAGIFGNVLGGNFSLVGVPSVGASGAIFGTVAVAWVDLFAHWRLLYRPGKRLAFMIVELVIGVAIGYIPYVDNFAHIGGFVMGLLVGTTFYPVISPSRRHKLIMWGFRVAAIPIAVILYVLLIRNFYTSDPYAACSGCRYLSCFPTNNNNHCKGTGE
ncbi:rhomboid-domain-containing protein [Auriscalpium vulgare]|uniref:Rhomboid-domain-containing protein n=1 Tax=Auriscalpium vulgare TaxID=40419 RepID=A0ACB8SBL9_9AGAM|nr:rhomboid-domain-containing protein [Auriscalpium vulgare]